ncbi:MAG: hypothetical protein WAK91_17055 [Candidatus Acidiferrales bacterium]
MSRLFRPSLALTLVSLAGVALHATTFIRLSPEKLAAAATLVIRARCIGNIVQVRDGEIWTVTSFEVREAWKGSAPAVIRTQLLGGRTAQLTSHVAGVPRFRAGEEAVIFLTRMRDGEYSIVSWAQGTFRVHRDAATRGLVVTQDTAAYQEPGRRSVAFKGRAVRNLPLEDFRRRIESALTADSAEAANVRRKQ